MADSRHNARILAIQKLFEADFASAKEQDTGFTSHNLLEINEIGSFNSQLYNSLLSGVQSHHENIDKVIAKLAPEWPIDKIAKTDLQILRIAIFEGFIAKITPEKVAIDEAIELAKEFSNDQSRKFVNGVLGSLISKKLDFTEYLTD